MKKAAKLLTCAAFIFITAISAFAQNPGDPNNGDDPDASIPLDGGLVSVLLSGAAIGIFKLIKKAKE